MKLKAKQGFRTPRMLSIGGIARRSRFGVRRPRAAFLSRPGEPIAKLPVATRSFAIGSLEIRSRRPVLRHKAMQDGRVGIESLSAPSSGSDKSARSLIDYDAGESIGVACTRPWERTLAAFGLLHVAETRFERCNDVTNGGVLAALPALVSNGLYHEIDKCFTEFNGYYSVTHVVTLLAFMALGRIRTVEKLRWQPPGELGKLLGLDRIPEARCLRNKLSELSDDGAAEKWGELLTRKCGRTIVSSA